MGRWGPLTSVTRASVLMERPGNEELGTLVPAVSSLVVPGKVTSSGCGLPLCQVGKVPACPPRRGSLAAHTQVKEFEEGQHSIVLVSETGRIPPLPTSWGAL